MAEISENKYMEITDPDDPVLSLYAQRSEVQLLRMNEPNPGFFIAESPNVIVRAVNAGYTLHSILVEKSKIEKEVPQVLQAAGDAPVYFAGMDMLKKITGFELTRGVLALMERKELPDAAELCRGCRRIAVLEEVVNPTNIGAIFRSAAALGVQAVLLTKGCSDPYYRRAARVSMGTVFQVPWTRLPEKKGHDLDINDFLHTQGFATAAMALEEDSVSIGDAALREEERLAIILGTEGEGLKKSTISGCDYTVMIPMKHGVDSLNVAAASAVAFWELCKMN